MLKRFFIHLFYFELEVNRHFQMLNLCEKLVFLCIAMIIGLILRNKTKILLKKLMLEINFEKSIFSDIEVLIILWQAKTLK